MIISDYIWKYFADYGIETAFVVTGGGAMFLNDSLRKESRIKYICNHHEQASSISAEGYYRATGKIPVVNVTSGPGGINTLTGVLGQWTDSIPVIYLSGQVKYKTTKAYIPNSKIRQFGDQEINIIDIVKPITKYAKMITDPYTISRELEKVLKIATTGRKGPVWLDVPISIQSYPIEEHLIKESKKLFFNNLDLKSIKNNIKETVSLLSKAKRPLIIAGHGIKLSQSKKELLNLIEYLDIPVVTTFNGFDILPNDSKNYIGRIGTIGNRSGNFALQNSDLILCLGTRNNIRQVSYNWDSFAKNAKKIIIDIDPAELDKPTVKGDLNIEMDVKDFMSELLYKLRSNKISIDIKEWKNWCLERKQKYPILMKEHIENKKFINPYHFINRLTTHLKKDAIVTAGNGTACVSLFQSGVVKEGQTYFWNSGCASMGYGLPASIGASVDGKKEVICITGDGSLQMNIQELQTIKQYDLPIKIFILNNNGYHSIIQTQTNWFNKEFIGCNEKSGVSFPDNKKVAQLYDLKYIKIDSKRTLDKRIKKVLNYKGSVLCEVMLPTDYIFMPKLSSEKQADGTMISQPLENMFPFLDKEERLSNLII